MQDHLYKILNREIACEANEIFFKGSAREKLSIKHRGFGPINDEDQVGNALSRVRVCVWVRVCVCACARVCMLVCLYLHASICVCMFMCVYACVCARACVRAYMCACVFTWIYTDVAHDVMYVRVILAS